MSIVELLRVATTALRTHVLRSFLTILGIVIGVAAVIMMVTVGAGAQAEIDRQISALGSNLLTVFPGSMRRGGVRTSGGDTYVLTEADATALTNEIPEIGHAAPVINGREQLIFGNQNWSCRLRAVTLEYLDARNWEIEEGRPFEPEEVETGARVILIGQTVADGLFGESSAVGQPVRVKNVAFTVVGLLKSKGTSTVGWDQDEVALIPLETARTRIIGRGGTRSDQIHGIYVSVREEWQVPFVEEEILRILHQRHRVRADRESPFSVRNMSEFMETRLEARNVLSYLLAVIASISLFVGGIGIMNIMLVSVTERTREIGLRMAVGAKGRHILSQFLVESVVLCGLGGVVGVACALAGSLIVANVAGWPILVQWWVIAVAILCSAGIGVFFGFYPALMAARKDPIAALRSE